jgi:hypothetical protein
MIIGLNIRIQFIIFILFNIVSYADNNLIAQETSVRTLPLIQTENKTPTSATNNLKNSDYEKVKRIYDKLVNARGDFRYPVPKLYLRKEESRVASIDYERLEIVLEDKAYKTCLEYGDAAIAFLLSHELTHYFEKHAWRNGFAADYADLPIGKSMKELQDQIANETQADYLGGFLAYSAGYGMFDKSSEIIKRLYTSYKIPENIPGYPSLNDRIELAKRTTQKLQSLIEVFEMANLLTAVGKYSEAYHYYNYILLQYQSREIYNNLGVTSILNALQYFKQEDLKFRYVVELDLESPGARDTESSAIRDSLLRQAIRNFDIAIGLDPDYAPAYLNKAAAFALLGDTIRAQFYTEQEALNIAQRNNYKKTAIDAIILSGILRARSGDSTSAAILFQAAASSGSRLAQINLDILKSGMPEQKAMTKRFANEFSSIDNHDLNTFSNNPNYNQDKVIEINSEYAYLQFNEDSLSFKISFNLNVDTREMNYFMLTKPDSKAMTEKLIGIGSSLEQIESQYGPPKQTIETPQGSILVYDKLIFIMNKENKVSRWGNYLTRKSML